ncbi:Chromatin-remodeling ATPase INO80 [Frankliniella fusca]|uniref:Chromatin-remodeling ATPase INO80 n=1 Tax=Frankliniella fusca TaxID=407009 RepID=A0AAE1HQY8_9NEOP|nr:Chromatin-remodeling ATPase INO80 [Frankliniella fusca]
MAWSVIFDTLSAWETGLGSYDGRLPTSSRPQCALAALLAMPPSADTSPPPQQPPRDTRFDANLVEQAAEEPVPRHLLTATSFRSYTTADSDASSAAWSGPCPCFSCSCFCVVCATSPLLVVLVFGIMLLVLALLTYPVVLVTAAQSHAAAHAATP